MNQFRGSVSSFVEKGIDQIAATPKR